MLYRIIQLYYQDILRQQPMFYVERCRVLQRPRMDVLGRIYESAEAG